MARDDRFPALTSLRFFAALHVVFFHYLTPLLAGWQGLARISSNGHTSVSFFFALSGFVLAHNYSAQGLSAPAARRQFWLKRFARIYPVYLFALAACAPFVVLHRFTQDHGAKAALKLFVSAVTNLTAMQAWFPPLSSAWNAPSWSISVEAFFYFAFPWLSRWLLSLERKWLALVAIWLWSLLVPLLALGLHLAPTTASPVASALGPFLRYGPLLHLPAFAFGVVLTTVRGALQLPPFALPAAIVGLLVSLWLAPESLSLVLNDGGLLPLHGILILAVATPKNAFNRILHHPTLVLFGEASYSLYILQVPVWLWLWPLLPETAPNLSRLIYLACVLSISVASYLWFEVPARRYLIKGWSGVAARA